MSNQNRNNGQYNNQNRNQNNYNTQMNLIVDPEARTATFTKTFKIFGKNKTGTFTAKYPTLTDKITIGTLRAKMLNGAPTQSVDKYTDDLSFMMAYVKTLLIKTPNWFDLTKLEDDVPLMEIFEEVSKWVNKFRCADDGSEDARSGDGTTNEKNMGSDEVVQGSN